MNHRVSDFAARHPDVVPGSYVVVSVSDTGGGMTDDVKERAFDPFYTTKPPGRGTGLGLSVCYGIVAEHGGRIEADSQPGRGPVFRVFLPVTGKAGS